MLASFKQFSTTDCSIIPITCGFREETADCSLGRSRRTDRFDNLNTGKTAGWFVLTYDVRIIKDTLQHIQAYEFI